MRTHATTASAEAIATHDDIAAEVRDRYRFDNIIGDSPAMHEVFAVVGQVAERAISHDVNLEDEGDDVLATVLDVPQDKSHLRTEFYPLKFADAGVIVITAFISPYRSDRELVRAMLLVLQQSSRGPATFVQDAAAAAPHVGDRVARADVEVPAHPADQQ